MIPQKVRTPHDIIDQLVSSKSWSSDQVSNHKQLPAIYWPCTGCCWCWCWCCCRCCCCCPRTPVGGWRISIRQVGQVCWRWNHDRKQLVWKIWLHGSLLQPCTISSRQMIQTLSPCDNSSGVASGYLSKVSKFMVAFSLKIAKHEVAPLHHI